MIGWLVVNHFMKSAKFDEIFAWLERAAQSQAILLIRKTNAELLATLFKRADDPIDRERPDFVLFWDKDVRLARYLQGRGLRLFNTAEAIELCDDKSLTHLHLMNRGLKMPRTILAPKSYTRIDYAEYPDLLAAITAQLGFPLIVKECFGSFGQQVYLTQDQAELAAIATQHSDQPLLFQSCVSTSYGRDIRIQVVGSKAVATMYRYSDSGDFRANLTSGARMKPYTPNEAQVQMALDACHYLGLDFAGVDILFGEQDEPILCEVNSNAHFKNIYDCTGVDVAAAIICHIRQQLQAAADGCMDAG